MVTHKPVKGVAFTSGVDVRGRPVALANLTGNGGLATVLPKPMNFQFRLIP